MSKLYSCSPFLYVRASHPSRRYKHQCLLRCRSNPLRHTTARGRFGNVTKVRLLCWLRRKSPELGTRSWSAQRGNAWGAALCLCRRGECTAYVLAS